jgi:hypothetical protein
VKELPPVFPPELAFIDTWKIIREFRTILSIARDLRWRNGEALQRGAIMAITKLVKNSEVVHPRSQTSFGKFFDAGMKVENREKDCRKKERVDDPEYH